MAELGFVSRVSPVHTALRNCTRDEGDGSPGDLRYPTGVHVKRPALRATGTQRPGQEGTSNSSRSAAADTKIGHKDRTQR
jgi:hypothetical protein